MYETSGSRCFASGVGTQMLMVSQLAQDGEVGRGVQPALAHQRPHVGGRDVLDVGLALVQLADAGLVDVDAEDLEPGLGQFDGERQADVAQADDAQPGGALVEAGDEDLGGGAVTGVPGSAGSWWAHASKGLPGASNPGAPRGGKHDRAREAGTRRRFSAARRAIFRHLSRNFELDHREHGPRFAARRRPVFAVHLRSSTPLGSEVDVPSFQGCPRVRITRRRVPPFFCGGAFRLSCRALDDSARTHPAARALPSRRRRPLRPARGRPPAPPGRGRRGRGGVPTGAEPTTPRASSGCRRASPRKIVCVGLNYVEHVRESLTVAPGAGGAAASRCCSSSPRARRWRHGGTIRCPAGVDAHRPRGRDGAGDRAPRAAHVSEARGARARRGRHLLQRRLGAQLPEERRPVGAREGLRHVRAVRARHRARALAARPRARAARERRGAPARAHVGHALRPRVPRAPHLAHHDARAGRRDRHRHAGRHRAHRARRPRRAWSSRASACSSNRVGAARERRARADRRCSSPAAALWPAARWAGADAVFVRGGRISAVGRAARPGRGGAAARARLDARGATVTPGLCDAHLHFVPWAQGRRQPDLLGAAHARRGARARGGRAGGGCPATRRWSGRGWDEMGWEARPRSRGARRAGAGPARSLLHSHDFHSLWVELGGAARGRRHARRRPIPPGGRFERDAAGEPTGVVRENAVRAFAALEAQAGPGDRRRRCSTRPPRRCTPRASPRCTTSSATRPTWRACARSPAAGGCACCSTWARSSCDALVGRGAGERRRRRVVPHRRAQAVRRRRARLAHRGAARAVRRRRTGSAW